MQNGICGTCEAEAWAAEVLAAEAWRAWNAATLVEEGRLVRDWLDFSDREPEEAIAEAFMLAADPRARHEAELASKMPWRHRNWMYGHMWRFPVRYVGLPPVVYPTGYIEVWLFDEPEDWDDPETWLIEKPFVEDVEVSPAYL